MIKMSGIVVDCYKRSFTDKKTQKEVVSMHISLLDQERENGRIRTMTVKNEALTPELINKIYLFKQCVLDCNDWSFTGDDGVTKSGFTVLGVALARDSA